jgi:hypothetical protein
MTFGFPVQGVLYSPEGDALKVMTPAASGQRSPNLASTAGVHSLA